MKDSTPLSCKSVTTPDSLPELQAKIAELTRQNQALVAANAVLAASEARLDRVLSGSDQGFWDWDLETNQFTVSERFESMLGYALGERDMAPERWASPEVVYPEDYVKATESIRRHITGETPCHETEIRCRTKSGEWKWILTCGRIVERATDGTPRLMSGTHTDITKRKAAEHALIAAKNEAEQANQAKSRFLAAASHDLRQPMQALNIFASVLQGTQLDGKQQQICASLRHTVATLSSLLDGLLDVSRLDANVVQPTLAKIDVLTLFHELDIDFSAVAGEKNLRFKFWYPDRPLVLNTDPELLRRMLRNLVSNALRYTERGGILVTARPRGEHVLFQVWDTGIGIAPEHLPQIWEEFFQAGNPQRDRSQGLGLGLSIVRRIGLLLGHQISCASRLGYGSIFGVCVPLAGSGAPLPAPVCLPASGTGTVSIDPATLAPSTPAELPFAGRHALLLDDDLLVATALEAWLEQLGFSVSCHAEAASALANPRAADADIYLVDYRLPGEMSGLDFLAAVRGRIGHAHKAIVMSGDTASERLASLETSGWPVLHKPVSPEDLLAVITRLCGEQTSRTC